MLYGAQLPTEGVLADEVRSATLEAMGPVVGVPAAFDNPAALKLDLVPVGGAPNDRTLSQRWNRALAVGVGTAAGLLGILLVMVGGPLGLLGCRSGWRRSRPRSRPRRCWASPWAADDRASTPARWRPAPSWRWPSPVPNAQPRRPRPERARGSA